MDARLENRYTVVKHDKLTKEQRLLLELFLLQRRIETTDAVVVEQDWPIYPQVVSMVMGTPDPSQSEREAFNAEYDRICNGPLTIREIAWRTWQARAQREAPQVAGPSGLRIIFDGPPDHEAGRFVEVETADGCSVNAGIWRERPDGLWELAFYDEAPLLRERLRVQQEEIEKLTRELSAARKQRSALMRDLGPVEPRTKAPECVHRFMYFGEQKARRCADCNVVETATGPTASELARAPAPAMQYYYWKDECTAVSAHEPKCSCWYDQGTGPHSWVRPGEATKHGTFLAWREKPAPKE